MGHQKLVSRRPVVAGSRVGNSNTSNMPAVGRKDIYTAAATAARAAADAAATAAAAAAAADNGDPKL